MIHIGRGSTTLGTFSEDEVREGLASGRFLLTDLGWKEGMAAWQPLSTFPELGGPPPPLPSFAPGSPELPAFVAGGARTGLPWENLPHNFSSFVETLKLVLTDPGTAFSRMRLEGGLTGPLIFNVAGSWIGLVAAMVYQVLYTSRVSTPSGMPDQPFAMTAHNSEIGLVMSVVLGPLFIVIGAFLGSFFMHLFLMLVGGANRPFEATLRVVCFSAGSTQVLQLIPVCGGLISAIWQLVCVTIGLSKAHEISIGRALAAVFLPLIVCCGGIAVATLFFFAHSHLSAIRQ